MRQGGDRALTVDKKLIRQALPYMLVVAVAVGVVVKAESETNAVSSRVTKVESPCLRYGPKSGECKEAFEAAVATITHPEACAIERKAGTLRAIRELAATLGVTFREPCAGARLAQEQQRGTERAATSQRASAGDGRGAPVSGGSGEAPAPGKGGSSGPSAPPKSTGPRHHPPSAPPESGSEGGTGPVEQGAPQGSEGSASSGGDAGEQTAAEARHESVLESAGATVGEVVNGGGHVVEATTCGLTGPLLCTKP
jgi:hypothetical protein